MASTYSDLKIELIGTGEQTGSWGATTNTNLGTAIEEAITGSADVTFSSADVTLTLTNTNATQAARNLRLVCTGTSGGARQLILGSGCQINKLYLIQNDLADAVTVKNTTGTGVTVAAGKKQFVFNNGTNVVAATDSTVNLASDVTGTLPVANGGTGQTSYTDGQLLIGNTSTGGLSKATLTAGSGITITPGSGSITIANNQAGGTVTSVAASGGSTGFTFTGSPITTSGTLTLSVSNAATIRSAISAPSTTGSGASGTWGISISGNAATASSADEADQLSTASGSAPSYAARAWVNFDGSGSSPSIRSDGNVSTVAYGGSAGFFTVNFSTSMSSSNYAVNVTSGIVGGQISISARSDTRATGSFTVSSVDQSGAGAFANSMMATVFI